MRGKDIEPLPFEQAGSHPSDTLPKPPTTIRMRGLPWKISREEIKKV